MLKKTILIALLLGTLASAQPTEIRVFQLSNRPAASAAETVRSLLTPAGTVLPDEQTNKLIVRDTPENLVQIEKLLQSIDVAAPQVMITIDFTGQSNQSGGNLSGGYSQPGGFNVNANQSQSTTTSHGQQKLMVMSGEEGHLVMGQQIAYVQPYWTLSQQYGLLPPGVVFQNVTTGFSVKPRVVGNVVTLEVAPWLSYQGDGRRGQITFAEAATTVRVNSGDSIAVGVSSQDNGRSGGGGGGDLYARRRTAWDLMLGGSSGSSGQSSSFVITPKIIPDWSKE